MAHVNMTIDGVTKETSKIRLISGNGSVKEAFLQAVTDELPENTGLFTPVEIPYTVRSNNEGSTSIYGDINFTLPDDNGYYIAVFSFDDERALTIYPTCRCLLAHKLIYANDDRAYAFAYITNDAGTSKDSCGISSKYLLKSNKLENNNPPGEIHEDGSVTLTGGSRFILTVSTSSYTIKPTKIDWFKVGGGVQ